MKKNKNKTSWTSKRPNTNHESLTNQVVYTSATPADYELGKSEGLVIEQVIRPTGLLDPLIHVRPSMNQIDDLMEEIQVNIERKERTLVTTLTKRMAEELHKYLNRFGLKTTYIHSDVADSKCLHDDMSVLHSHGACICNHTASDNIGEHMKKMQAITFL